VRVVLFCLLAGIFQANAQTYPAKPIKLLVPFPSGSATDHIARLTGSELQQALGQPVIVENKPGAQGGIAAAEVAKAAPDGYTLLLTSTPHVILPQLHKNIPFDALNDFAPIMQFGDQPYALTIHPSLGVSSVKELIALAQKQPGKLHFASAGPGSTNHLSGELFKSMAKIDIAHVPYRGAGPAMNDLVGGHVQMFFDLLPVSLPQISGGKVRALANAGATRPSALPDLPTMAEQGLTGFDASSWYGFVAPAKTPDAVVARLAEETQKILKSPEVIARIRELGSEPGSVFRADFAAFMRKEAEKWGEVIRVSGAKAE